MASIADIFVTVMPETSKIADGITAAFRRVDPEAREAGKRWGREIQQGLTGVDVELKADTAKAKTEIDAATKDKKTTVEVNADTAKAKAEIDEAAKDRKTKVKLDIDQSEWAALTSMLAKGDRDHASAMSGFLRARRDMMSTKSDPLDWADSVIKMQSAGTALTASLAGAGVNAASSVGSSLSGAMGPVGTALTVALVGGAVVAAAGVAGALSGAIGLIPAGLGGGVAVLGTLLTGLDGVKDAWDAAGKAADSATKDQAEKAKSVASAQKTLRDAVLDEATAQKDVANARKDARVQLEDLNVQLRGGVIDEKSAILDAQAARRDLATGRFKDAIEYQQAQLRVQQADQRVLESHERNVQLQDKATESNAKGVGQSDQVVAANQRLAKAHADVATAQNNLAEAQKKPSSAVEALSIAMGKLSPTAQAFIGTLESLKPAWTQLKFAVQDSLFAGIGPQLQSLATQYLPVLKTAMTGLAGTMNSAFKDVGAWLSKPETLSTIQQIVANIGSSFQVWSQSLVPFSNAFLTITQVGAGFLPSLGKVITDGANAFNNFIQSASKSGELQQWMRTGIEALAQLMKMLPVIGKMFLDLAPLAVPFLQSLNLLLPMIEPVFQVIGVVGERAATGFAKFLNTAKQTFGELWGVLKTLGNVFETVWGKISGVIDRAWKIIKPILDEFKKALSLLNPGDILGKISRFLGGDNVVAGTPTAAASSGAFVGGGGSGSAAGGGSGSGSALTPSSSGGLFGSGGGSVTGSGFGGGSWFGSGQTASPIDAALTKALAAKGFSPALISLIQGFSQVEGNNRFGVPTLGFTDGQLGGAGDLQSHVDALAKQIADRSSVAGVFPESGSKEQQAQWIAKVVGQSGLSSDWQGNAQPQDYVQRVMGAMGGPGGMPSAMPSVPSTAGLSGIAMPGGDKATYTSQMLQSLGLSPLAENPAGGGSPQIPQWVQDFIHAAGGPSLTANSTPHGSLHGVAGASDYAVDIGGNAADQDRLAAFLRANPGLSAQMIHQSMSGEQMGVAGGVDVSGRYYTSPGGSYADHTDHVHWAPSIRPGAGGVPGMDAMYPSAAGMPTMASPQGVSPSGMPLGTQQQPMYVMPAQGGSGGQQLGQDMVSGVMEMFGFDGSLFKNPMDSGLFKGFKGGMSFFTGLLGGGKGGQGGMSGGGGDGGGMPAMGGGGDMISGLGSMLTGMIPQPFGENKIGGPAQAPGAYQPMLPGSGGSTGLPGGGLAPQQQGQRPYGNVDQSSTYILNGTPPPGAHDFLNGIQVPGFRQGMKAVPGG